MPFYGLKPKKYLLHLWKAYKDQHKENENLAEIQEFKFDTPDKEVYIDSLAQKSQANRVSV